MSTPPTTPWSGSCAGTALWPASDDLLTGLSAFLAERVFGPQRRELLAQDLKETDTRSAGARVERVESLQKQLADVRQLGERLMLTLETQDDPDPVCQARLRRLL